MTTEEKVVLEILENRAESSYERLQYALKEALRAEDEVLFWRQRVNEAIYNLDKSPQP